MDTKRQIGTRIRKARENLGITQEDLAMRIGKSQDAISSYENGSRVIQLVELPTLAKALGVPIAYFFGDEFPEQELIAIYDRLSQKGKKMMLEYAHLLEREFE